MAERKNKSILQIIAQIFSDLFSPIMMPTYMIAFAVWTTPLVVIPEKVRLIVVAIVFVICSVIPTAVIVSLIRLGKVGDVSLSERKERTLPYIVSVLCYVGAAIYLSCIRAPFWLADFYIGAAVTSFLALLITFRWKISAHAAAVGGFASAVTWLAISHALLSSPLLWLSAVYLICGIVGSSRLILGRHDAPQVFAGYLLGAASVYITLAL